MRSLRSPTLPRFRISQPSLRSVCQMLQRVISPPLVGFTSVQLSPQTNSSRPPFDRSELVWVRLASFASLTPQLHLTVKPARRGVMPQKRGMTTGASPPNGDRALGCALSGDGGGLSPATCQPIGVGSPHRSATLRARLTRLRRDVRCALFALPHPRHGCRFLRSLGHDGAAPSWATLCFAAIHPRSLRPRVAKQHAGTK